MLKPEKNKEKGFDKLFGKVYFEGNVLSAPVYNNSTLLCIKIDTASVDSFYCFNRGDWALCIHDGVAVMPIGMIGKYDSVGLFKATAHHVVVNKDHNKKALFIRDNDTLQKDLDLWPAKLEEKYAGEKNVTKDWTSKKCHDIFHLNCHFYFLCYMSFFIIT